MSRALEPIVLPFSRGAVCNAEAVLPLPQTRLESPLDTAPRPFGHGTPSAALPVR